MLRQFVESSISKVEKMDKRCDELIDQANSIMNEIVSAERSTAQNKDENSESSSSSQ